MSDAGKLTIRYMGNAYLSVGKKEEEVPVEDQFSLASLLQGLIGVYGERFRTSILDDDGELKSHVLILINGQSSKLLDGPDTLLRGGDVIAFASALGGG